MSVCKVREASDMTVTANHCCSVEGHVLASSSMLGLALSLIDASLVAVFDSFFSMKWSCLYFVHRKCLADGGRVN